MPGKLKIRIFSARNLPIMDRSSDSSDAFVEVRLGANNYDKTQVCKRSLDPNFNARFIFEVEEDEIQEEPLQIRVLDHDTYSSHDAIGKVYIDLKPLLNSYDAPSSISGWFPIYDTLHGIRGEIRVQAKVELFNDCNEYRKSSSGVQFFCSSKVPEGYVLQHFCGFVEELVVNDDPEYQWIDKIRTPRTSNEARQKLFSKLSGELQRRIGLKVLDIDANCVLGYLQNFDLEGEHGIVVRGIGTAAYITKYNSPPPPTTTLAVNSTSVTTSASQQHPLSSTSPNSQSTTLFKCGNSTESSSLSVATANLSNTLTHNKDDNSENSVADKSRRHQPAQLNLNLNPIVSPTSQQSSSSAQPSTQTLNNNNNNNNIKLNKVSPSRALLRIHSDSDLNAYQHQQPVVTQLSQVNSILTTTQQQQQSYVTVPPTPAAAAEGQQHKQSLLDKLEYPFLTIQQYPPGFIKSISGIVCARSVKLLSSSAILEDLNTRDKWWIEIRNEIRSHMKALNCHAVLGYTETKSICEDVCVLSASGTAALVDESYFHADSPFKSAADQNNKSCQLCHVAYSEHDLPFPIALCPCRICGQGLVPDIIFSSIQPVPEIEIVGQGCLLRAIITRPHKKCSGEISAKIISDYLPFMEYELHRQLVGKLKIKGMNMLYGLRFQVSIGENLLIGLAEATACFAAALPPPVTPKIVSEKIEYTNQELKELDELSRLIDIKMKQNRDFFNLNIDPNMAPMQQLNSQDGSGASGANEQENNLLTNTSSPTLNDPKALFKIELDDVRDRDGVVLLLDSAYKCKDGFYCCSTELMPGISKFNDNLQMFTSVFRCETSLVQMSTRRFSEICDDILQSLFYKFRKYPNCCLSNLSFDHSLYDDDHAMIIITGCCLTFDSSDSPPRLPSVQATAAKQQQNNTTTTLNQLAQPSCKSANDVEITTLSYVPNATIDAYLGHINLFLIRESTQIKENGGLSGFMHCFISEMLALARAHVLSLGGNALISFKMNECVLLDNPHRNQGQCLLNVAGDAVRFKKC